MKQANILLQNCGNNEIKNTFKNTKVVLAHRQPPNILRRLSKARFESSDNDHLRNGLYSCKRKICKICKLYLKECTSFRTANDFEWIIKCHISCNSRNVKCLVRKGKTTYTGKTNIIRLRTNNHISGCKHDNFTNIFHYHVFACKQGKNLNEPYFELYAFMTVKNERDLLTHMKHSYTKKITIL